MTLLESRHVRLFLASALVLGSLHASAASAQDGERAIMAPRLHLRGLLAFGGHGRLEVGDEEVDDDLQLGYGGAVEFEAPLSRYFTLGGAGTATAWQADLENCLERAIALARFDQVTLDDLPEKVRAYRADRFVLSADEVDEVVNLEQVERAYVFRVLKLVTGNKSRAAQLLGLDRRTLYRKLDRYAAEAKSARTESREHPLEA